MLIVQIPVRTIRRTAPSGPPVLVVDARLLERAIERADQRRAQR